MNFKIGTPMEHEERYQVPRPPITACEVGFLHAGWCMYSVYRVGRTQRPRNLLLTWCNLTKSPQVLHRGWPESLRLHNVVSVVPQFTHRAPGRRDVYSGYSFITFTRSDNNPYNTCKSLIMVTRSAGVARDHYILQVFIFFHSSHLLRHRKTDIC